MGQGEGRMIYMYKLNQLFNYTTRKLSNFSPNVWNSYAGYREYQEDDESK